METGESPFANVIVAFSLLSCFTLLLSLPIRKFFISRGWENNKIKLIEIILRLLPVILFLILFIRYLFAHLFLDSSHVHVAFHLDSDSQFTHRLMSLFAGYDGASIMLMSMLLLLFHDFMLYCLYIYIYICHIYIYIYIYMYICLCPGPMSRKTPFECKLYYYYY